MKSGTAYVIFELDGQRFEYDGGLPNGIVARFSHLLDNEGFWRDGYPELLSAEMKDERDELPTALYNIRRIGGKVIEVHSAAENGAIHWEDWKCPRIY